MSTTWKKLSSADMRQRVFTALAENINYDHHNILGVPASYLDDKVFNQDAAFVKDAPFISTLAQNPNHIGCHTLGTSEPFFQGTQAIERELLDICAVDILGATAGAYDGYVASGGTEANLQAVWVYRNYFRQQYGALNNEVTILCTTDSHYCVDKAANIFDLSIHKVPIAEDSRQANLAAMQASIQAAQQEGIKYFIVVANMMTTMFGSVDSVANYVTALQSQKATFRIHIDGAYGGFYYPFTAKDRDLTYANPQISSFNLEAHKMAQAPYGTGIFLIRKDLIHHTNTQEARYVAGEDFTLIGSRSGANAVAVWMILVNSGPYGWREKIFILQQRAEWLSKQLTERRIAFFRHPQSNIITIQASFVPTDVAAKYHLVPDDHHAPAWYKVVIMDHVTIEKLLPLVEELQPD
ncbi:MAG: pyridoxal-dependent decarboxylase [Bacteroidota bacterium]